MALICSDTNYVVSELSKEWCELIENVQLLVLLLIAQAVV